MKKIISAILATTMTASLAVNCFATQSSNTYEAETGVYHCFSNVYQGNNWETIVYVPNNGEMIRVDAKSRNSEAIYSVELHKTEINHEWVEETVANLANNVLDSEVHAIGEAGLLNALYDAGITMNDVNPDYVVIGEGKSYSLDTLTKATNLVLKGAKLIGANSDLTGPIENGIAPACRALIAPIELATGKQAYFCGKPNPLMMRTGLNILGCHSAEAVMVGDRMDTDVISGMECGMSTVLVLSGVSARNTIDTFAYRPTMVLDGVGDIVAIADTQKK